MKYLMLFVPFLVFAKNSEWHKLHQSAREHYYTHHQDYVNEAQQTLVKWRSLRGILINEKFQTSISDLEKKLIQANKEIIQVVEKEQKKSYDRIYLDDATLMRLAQLYFERSNNQLTSKMNRYNAKMKDYLAGKINKAPKLPEPNYKDSLNTASRLLRSFPNSPFADQAEYLLSYIYEETGEFSKAKAIYEFFLKRYPYSKFRDEVSWRLAELKFEFGQTKDARKIYLELSKKLGSRFELKSLYKLGASLYQDKLYKWSAKMFRRLFTRLENSLLIGKEAQTLYDESLEYLGLLQEKGVDIKLAPEIKAKAAKKLIQVLERNNRFEESRKLAFRFIQKNPMSPFVPEFYALAIESLVQDAKLREAEKARQLLFQSFFTSKAWWKKNKNNFQSYFAAQDLLEKQILESARYKADLFYQKKNKRQFAMAESHYRKFLKEYFYSPRANEGRYELGLLYYFNNNYKLANQYLLQALEIETKPQVRDEISYSFLLSVLKENQISLASQSNLRELREKDGKLASQKELAGKAKIFENAAQIYLKNSKNSFRMAQVTYRLAQLYFVHNQFQAAEDIINQMLLDTQVSDIRRISALQLKSEIANIQGDYQKLARINQEVIEMSPSGDYLAIADSVLELGVKQLKTAQQLETASQFRASANLYKEYALLEGKIKYQDYALLKAAQIYWQANQYKDSLALIPKLEKTKYKAQAQYLKAVNYLDLLQRDKAQVEYETFLKRFPRDDLVPQVLLSLSKIFAVKEDFMQAAKILLRYHKYVKTDFILYQVADYYYKANNQKEMNKVLNLYEKSYPQGKIQADGLRAQFFWKNKKMNAANKICSLIQQNFASSKSNTANAEKSFLFCHYYNFIAKLKEKKYSNPQEAKQELELLRSKGQYELYAKALNDLGEYIEAFSGSEKALEYYEEAWSSANQKLIIDQAKRASNNLTKAGVLKINRDQFINWNLYRSELVDWQDNKTVKNWSSALVDCKEKQSKKCAEKFQKIYEETKDSNALLNRIKNNLISSEDDLLFSDFKLWAEKNNWFADSISLAVLLGFEEIVPQNRLRKHFQEINGTAHLALLAQAKRLMDRQKYTLAKNLILKAIEKNSEFSPSYAQLAILNFSQEKLQESRRVLNQALKNTQNNPAIVSIYRMIDASPLDESIESKDLRIDYALAIQSLNSNDRESFSKYLSRLENYEVLQTELQMISHIYFNSKRPPYENKISKSSQLALIASYLEYSNSHDKALALLRQSKQMGNLSPSLNDLNRIYEKRNIASEKENK